MQARLITLIPANRAWYAAARILSKLSERRMKTRLVLKPGQRGTKRLLERYGEDLVCVRFRYDAELQQRLKTVELVVERTEWTPPAPRYPLDSLVPLQIEAADLRKRTMAKAAGGKWNPDVHLWFVRYGNIVGTSLEKHIHVDANRTG